MDTELLFEKLYINSELADQICSDLNLTRTEFREYSRKLDTERKCEIEQIRRIRTLYHNKKGLTGFTFPNFNIFYNWYVAQYDKQKGKCYYCETEERIIAKLFENKYQNRKRTKRGKHLEIERRNSTLNAYNADNCVLACYFCNNDKSDIFDELEYLDYLKDRNRFLKTEFEKLNGSR
jgi:hypothetical protein